MKTLSIEKTRQILEVSTENIGLEFKSSFDFEDNNWLKEKTYRAILAMSNTRGGGDIVIGVKERADTTFNLSGLEKDHLDKFRSKLEDLKSQIESFATEPVSYEIYDASLDELKHFLIIRISEFRRRPIICRKNGREKDILEQGAIYIRTLKDKPSSVKIVDPLDIQDLLERSVDKEISSLHMRGWKHESEQSKSNSKSFDKERKDF